MTTRTARWCGSCGAELTPAADATGAADAPATRGRRWTLAAAVVVVVALAAVGVLVSGGLVDRGTTPSPTVADDDVTAPDDDVLDRLEPADEPPQGPVDEPTCAEGPPQGCFLWAVEVGHTTVPYGFAVRSDHHLVGLAPDDGTIWARDLRDGEVVWSFPGATTSEDEVLVLTGDLVLHRADGALVARHVTTGEERWRNPELGDVALRGVRQLGEDDLLVTGDHGDASADAVLPHGPVLLGLDPATGDLRWHHGGREAVVTIEGIGLVLDDDHLTAYEPNGELRWAVDVPASSDSSSTSLLSGGHVAVVDQDEEPMRLHRLVDGERLGFAGAPLAVDTEHTLVAEVEVAGGGGWSMTGQLVLLDRQGEVWRSTLEDIAGCPISARLETAAVVVTACASDEHVLDRADGTVRSVTTLEGPIRRRVSAFGDALGPYDIAPTVGDDPELVLVDRASGEEVARLASESWPVRGGEDLFGWGPGAAGVAVVQSPGWLVALDLDGRG